METSSAPSTLVERDKLDISSLIPPKGEMKSSFSWTCPFKSPTSSTFCFDEPTLGKINQETDVSMTKHTPKPSSGANRVSVSHSSLVTKNGEHFYNHVIMFFTIISNIYMLPEDSLIVFLVFPRLNYSF